MKQLETFSQMKKRHHEEYLDLIVAHINATNGHMEKAAESLGLHRVRIFRVLRENDMDSALIRKNAERNGKKVKETA